MERKKAVAFIFSALCLANVAMLVRLLSKEQYSSFETYLHLALSIALLAASIMFILDARDRKL